MRPLRCLVLGLAVSTASGMASASDAQAESFSRIYAGACVQHITDLKVLRDKLRDAPQLPPEKAALFLSQSPGAAYPVPDKNGTFVVALSDDKPMCALFARRVNAQAVEKRFANFALNAPHPFVARLLSEESGTSAVNGPTKTIVYEWAQEGGQVKIILALTTATSETAQLQGMASISLSK